MVWLVACATHRVPVNATKTGREGGGRCNRLSCACAGTWQEYMRSARGPSNAVHNGEAEAVGDVSLEDTAFYNSQDVATEPLASGPGFFDSLIGNLRHQSRGLQLQGEAHCVSGAHLPVLCAMGNIVHGQ